MRGAILFASAWASLSAPAVAGPEAPATAAAARDRITVADDALEVEATFTTREVERERRGLLGAVPFDAFLRAFVDKRSGRSRFEVYVSDTYRSRYWTRWTVANYETPDGPAQVRLTRIVQARSSYCTRRSACLRNETVGFAVPESALRAAAGGERPWVFKLKGQDGTDRIVQLSAGEIGGLFTAIDDWRTARGLAIR